MLIASERTSGSMLQSAVSARVSLKNGPEISPEKEKTDDIAGLFSLISFTEKTLESLALTETQIRSGKLQFNQELTRKLVYKPMLDKEGEREALLKTVADFKSQLLKDTHKILMQMQEGKRFLESVSTVPRLYVALGVSDPPILGSGTARERLLREYANALRILRLEQRYDEVTELTGRILDAPKNFGVSFRKQSEIEAQVSEQLKGLKIADLATLKNELLCDALARESYRAYFLKKFDPSKLKPGEQAVWNEYNDCHNPKGDLFNPTDATFDRLPFLTVDLAASAPLIVVSGGTGLALRVLVAKVIRGSVVKVASDQVARTVIRATARQAIERVEKQTLKEFAIATGTKATLAASSATGQTLAAGSISGDANSEGNLREVLLQTAANFFFQGYGSGVTALKGFTAKTLTASQKSYLLRVVPTLGDSEVRDLALTLLGSGSGIIAGAVPGLIWRHAERNLNFRRNPQESAEFSSQFPDTILEAFVSSAQVRLLSTQMPGTLGIYKKSATHVGKLSSGNLTVPPAVSDRERVKQILIGMNIKKGFYNKLLGGGQPLGENRINQLAQLRRADGVRVVNHCFGVFVDFVPFRNELAKAGIFSLTDLANKLGEKGAEIQLYEKLTRPAKFPGFLDSRKPSMHRLYRWNQIRVSNRRV